MIESTATLYAVSRGSYSDYGVVAIFSTKEKAEEYMLFVPSDDYNDIETYELDPGVVDKIRKGYSPWFVIMLRDGTTEEVRRQEVSSYSIGSSAWIHRRSTLPSRVQHSLPDCIVVHTMAKSEEHAVKIANEKRVQFIANGEWE